MVMSEYKQKSQRDTSVDGVYAYPILFGHASGQVLCRSQGTLLPLSVNPRYRIHGTNLLKLRTLRSSKANLMHLI
jgi:hypothetical protein